MKLFIVCALLAAAVSTVSADELISVYVNGAHKQMEPSARVRDGVAYAPLRAAAEAVGAHVDWQERAQRAIVCTDTRCADVRKSDGIVVDGRLLIPLRLMAEALGAQVSWDSAARAVRISTGAG